VNLQEQERMVQQLVATAEVMGHQITLNAALMMCQDLSEYAFNDVMIALTRCRKEVTGKLTLKAIVDLLAPAGGWLSANEAWAQALPAQDEANTMVWTVETRKAWFIALPILESGDKIGARMAFIEAYNREVAQAKAAGGLPQIEVSRGDRADLYDLAVSQAQTSGLLPPPREPAPLLLDAPKHVKVRGPVQDRKEDLSAALRELSSKLRAIREDDHAEKLRRSEEDRQRFEARKAEVVAQALELDKQRRENNDE
jgi:hypothetical protein